MQRKASSVHSLGYKLLAESWASQKNHWRLVERHYTSQQMEAGGKQVKDRAQSSLFSSFLHKHTREDEL